MGQRKVCNKRVENLEKQYGKNDVFMLKRDIRSEDGLIKAGTAVTLHFMDDDEEVTVLVRELVSNEKDGEEECFTGSLEQMDEYFQFHEKLSKTYKIYCSKSVALRDRARIMSGSAYLLIILVMLLSWLFKMDIAVWTLMGSFAFILVYLCNLVLGSFYRKKLDDSFDQRVKSFCERGIR